jgi:hypothetical protein
MGKAQQGELWLTGTPVCSWEIPSSNSVKILAAGLLTEIFFLLIFSQSFQRIL